MIISENLKKSSIIVRVKSKKRWDLIEEMLDLAIKNKDIKDEDKEIIKKYLIEREKTMSTGIGKGIAIPHCTTAKITDIIIIIAISENGIDFNSIDNLPVRIAILLLVPKNKLSQHIKTLATLAKMLNDDELRENLVTLKTPESIIKTIKEFEKSPKK